MYEYSKNEKVNNYNKNRDYYRKRSPLRSRSRSRSYDNNQNYNDKDYVKKDYYHSGLSENRYKKDNRCDYNWKRNNNQNTRYK